MSGEEDKVVLPRRLQTIEEGQDLIEERSRIGRAAFDGLDTLRGMTSAAYAAYTARWLEWHRINGDVLRRMFDTPGIAEQYSAIRPDAEPSYRSARRNGEVIIVEDFIAKTLGELDLISTRLPLYLGPEDKPPALVTGMVEREAGERKNVRARIFIASSTDGVSIADAIQARMEPQFEMTVWNQGVFEPSRYTLETLERALGNFDYAVFVFTPDDTIIFEGNQHKATRDNVIFELGLFIGRLGRGSCFIVHPRTRDFHIPSDLLALQTLRYESERQDGNLEAAVSPVVTRIRSAIATVNRREPNVSRDQQE